MKKFCISVTTSLLLAITIKVTALAQCTLTVEPPVVLLAPGGPPVAVGARLTNNGPVGFFITGVTFSANLNDGKLVTFTDPDPIPGGIFVPVGGSYSFRILFGPGFVPAADVGRRVGTVTATVSTGAICSFDFLVLVDTGHCDLFTNPPDTMVDLMAGGTSLDVPVRLTNTSSGGFFLDSVKLYRNASLYGLNDGFLVTTQNSVPGTFVPMGGNYDFALHFDPSAVPSPAAGQRDGVVMVFIKSFGVEWACELTISADVFAPRAKGDLDGNGAFSPTDVVLMLNCAYFKNGPCALAFADVDCSGNLSAADVVLELNKVFLSQSFPC